jgi:hypothetical protein
MSDGARSSARVRKAMIVGNARRHAVAVVCTGQRRVHHRRHGLDQTVPILYISSVRIAFRVCRPMTGQDHILDRMVDKRYLMIWTRRRAFSSVPDVSDMISTEMDPHAIVRTSLQSIRSMTVPAEIHLSSQKGASRTKTGQLWETCV